MPLFYKLVSTDDYSEIDGDMHLLLDDEQVTKELTAAANDGRRTEVTTTTDPRVKRWQEVLETASDAIISIKNKMKSKNRKNVEIVDAIAGWIRGGSEPAKAFRSLGRYMIGEGITKADAKAMAEMCLRPPAALRDKIAECSSPYRYMMVNVENDLTEQRVMMTVLASYGRCVYCNVTVKPYVLITQPNGVRADDLRATADHIYPVHPDPDTDDAAGGTVFGNMAISCLACNQDKANHSPVKWLASTDLLDTSARTNARRRLDLLRVIAGWEPVSKSRMDTINEEVSIIRRLVELNPGIDSDAIVKVLVAGHLSPVTRKLLG